MKKTFFLMVLILSIISACSSKNELDNSIQTNMSDIQNLENQNKIQQLQEEVNTLKKELDQLKGELDKTKPHTLNYAMDLNVWSEDDIVNGLAKRNKKFENATWFVYQYRDDGHYYDLVGPIYPYDPFNQIVYEKRNRELTVSHLRMFNLDPGETGIADQKFQKYLASIDKMMRTTSDFNCVEETDCRNTKLITCKSSGSTLYLWYASPFLMTSMDDNQEAYRNFLSLYCEEAKSGLLELTGNFIKTIVSFFK